MSARIDNPARALPGVEKAIGTILAAVHGAGVPEATLELVHMRVSQINGCTFCVDLGARTMRKAGESDERMATVAAWRDAPWFSDAERAALALAEAATRLADRSDPVPDVIWDAAAAHYDPTALAGLVTAIAMTNLFNRVNVMLRQPPGVW